jgi:hypothetical protein
MDIVERLREPIDYIEAVKIQIEASYLDCVAKHNLTLDELAAAEAREAKLREAIHFIREYVGEERLPALPGWSWFDALNLPADDTALKEALKQAKREALLEAAEYVGRNVYDTREYAEKLRQMVEELTQFNALNAASNRRADGSYRTPPKPEEGLK